MKQVALSITREVVMAVLMAFSAVVAGGSPLRRNHDILPIHRLALSSSRTIPQQQPAPRSVSLPAGRSVAGTAEHNAQGGMARL
jgi:hypothetical protein